VSAPIQLLLNEPSGKTTSSTCKFYELAIGARLECHGQLFTKLVMSMAEDSPRTGNAFWWGTEVYVVGHPLLLLNHGRSSGSMKVVLDHIHFGPPSPKGRWWRLSTLASLRAPFPSLLELGGAMIMRDPEF